MADNNKKSNFSSLSQGEGRGEALITGAEALMRSLEHQGVKTIFGYPGGSIMPVFDALYDHRKELNHILVRHEQGATHAAQGFARVSGEVGVCLVTSGPGATNTITGIADAMIDSTPIVVIAGQVGTNFLGTDAFQEVDLVGITQPITKWSYQIRRAEDVAWAVARAFYVAKSGRPGPVVLDFAMDYKAPFAIRYPRGTAYRGLKEFMQPIAYGKGEIIYEEENIALLAVGSMVSTGEHVRAKLKEEGVSCTLANARFVKPFDKELVDRLAKNHRLIVTMEENVLQGGFGLPVTAYIHEHYPQVKVMNIALPDAYVEHGNVSVLRKGLGIDSDSIIQRLKAEGWL